MLLYYIVVYCFFLFYIVSFFNQTNNYQWYQQYSHANKETAINILSQIVFIIIFKF